MTDPTRPSADPQADPDPTATPDTGGGPPSPGWSGAADTDAPGAPSGQAVPPPAGHTPPYGTPPADASPDGVLSAATPTEATGPLQMAPPDRTVELPPEAARGAHGAGDPQASPQTTTQLPPGIVPAGAEQTPPGGEHGGLPHAGATPPGGAAAFGRTGDESPSGAHHAIPEQRPAAEQGGFAHAGATPRSGSTAAFGGTADGDSSGAHPTLAEQPSGGRSGGFAHAGATPRSSGAAAFGRTGDESPSGTHHAIPEQRPAAEQGGFAHAGAASRGGGAAARDAAPSGVSTGGYPVVSTGGHPVVTGDPSGAAGKGKAVPAPRRKERDPFFDNAKFLAILLVVIGHSIAGLMDVPLAKALYFLIYMFHMPLFIVITGYFSRNWSASPGKARKLITNVGVPYVVFETAYSTYDWLVGRNDLEISLLNPYYLTWFLCALFMWRLSTPVWQQIRWPLAVAVGFSLMSYMSPMGGTFDIHRVIGLLPFYVLGLMLRPEHFEIVKRPMSRVLGAAILAGGFGVAYLAMDHMSRKWLYWKDPHVKLGVDNVTGTVMRLAMFACAVTLVFAFLSLVPRRRTWFTGLGAYTLYTYLLHGFYTRLLSFLGWWDLDWMNTTPGVLVVIAVALVVGTVLCTKPVVRCMSWALEPKMTWAFTRFRRLGAPPAKGKGRAPRPPQGPHGPPSPAGFASADAKPAEPVVR
ncbi:acyltransferase family protein [Actinomadura keratinilytica]|uniref:Acyltransferase 3 domain-containing protein n=1 Tax=Actinomadura keratinilytica TaxID=547461 RepID=A0ABP7Y1N4_9ACTN